MDGDEEYYSDSTVLLEDFNEKLEKIEIKKRRLSSYRDRGNQSDQYEDENKAPDDVSVTRRTDHASQKQTNRVDKEWLVTRYLTSVNNSNVTNMHIDDYNKEQNVDIHGKVINYIQVANRGNGTNNNVKEDAIINLDSDDEAQIGKITPNQDVNSDEKSRQNEHIHNSTPKAQKPASVSTRRATTDVIEQNKKLSHHGDSQRVEENKIPKIRILKPSAINARRATTHFEENNSNNNSISRMITVPQDMKSDIEKEANRVKITSPKLANLQRNYVKVNHPNLDNNDRIGLSVAVHDVNTATSPAPALKTDIEQNESVSNIVRNYINNSSDSQRVEENTRPKIKILKSSAINARRATTHFEDNNSNYNQIGRMITVPQNITSDIEKEANRDNITSPKLAHLQSNDANPSTTHFEDNNSNYNPIGRMITVPQDITSDIEKEANRVKITSPKLANLQSNDANPSNHSNLDSNNIISIAVHDINTATSPAPALQTNINEDERNTVRNDKIKVSNLKASKRCNNNESETKSKRVKKNKKPKDMSPVQYNNDQSKCKDKHKANEKVGSKKTDGHDENRVSVINTTDALNVQTASTEESKDKNPMQSTKDMSKNKEKPKLSDKFARKKSKEHDENKVTDINTTGSSNEQKAPRAEELKKVSENRKTTKSDTKLETDDLRDDKLVSGTYNKQVLNELLHKQIIHEAKLQNSNVTAVEGATKVPNKLADTKIQHLLVTNEVSDKQVTNKVQSNQDANNARNELEMSKLQDEQGTSKLHDEQDANNSQVKPITTKVLSEVETGKHHNKYNNQTSEIHEIQETDKSYNKNAVEELNKHEAIQLHNEQITSNKVSKGNKETNRVSANQNPIHDEIDTKKIQEANSDKTIELGNVQETVAENEETCKSSGDKYNESILKIHVGFFTLVKEYFEKILPNFAKTFQDLIETLIVGARNGQVQTNVRYTCPMCSYVSSYSSCSLNNPADEESNSTAIDSQECNFCSGIRKLHTAYMKKLLAKQYSANHDKCVENEFIEIDHESQSAENSENRSTREIKCSHLQTQSVTKTIDSSVEEVGDSNYSSTVDNKKQGDHTISHNNCEADTGNHDVSVKPLVHKEPCKKTLQNDNCSSFEKNLEKREQNDTITRKEDSDLDIPISEDNEICAHNRLRPMTFVASPDTILTIKKKRKSDEITKKGANPKRIKIITKENIVQNDKQLTANANQDNGDSVDERPNKVVIISVQNVTNQGTSPESSIESDIISNVKLSEVIATGIPNEEVNKVVVNAENDNKENASKELPNKSTEMRQTDQNIQEACTAVDNGSRNVSEGELGEKDKRNEKNSENTPVNNIPETSNLNANVEQIRHSNENDKDGENVIKSLENCFEKIKDNAPVKKVSSTPPPKNNKDLPDPTSKRRKSHNTVSSYVAVRRVVVKYICPICTCGYVYASKLLRHIKEQHSPHYKIIPENCVLLQCPFCPILLMNKKYNKHVKQQHPNKFAENVDSMRVKTLGSTHTDSDKATECDTTPKKSYTSEEINIESRNKLDASNGQGSITKESNQLLRSDRASSNNNDQNDNSKSLACEIEKLKSSLTVENRNQQGNELSTNEKNIGEPALDNTLIDKNNDSGNPSISKVMDNESKQSTIEESDQTEVKKKKTRTITVIVTKIEALVENKFNDEIRIEHCASSSNNGQIDNKSSVSDNVALTPSSTAENRNQHDNELSAIDKDSTKNAAIETSSKTRSPDSKQSTIKASNGMNIKKRKTRTITLFGEKIQPVVQNKTNKEVTIEHSSLSSQNKSSASDNETLIASSIAENRNQHDNEPSRQDKRSGENTTENAEITENICRSVKARKQSNIKACDRIDIKKRKTRTITLFGDKTHVSAEKTGESAERTPVIANEGTASYEDTLCIIKNKEQVVSTVVIDKSEYPSVDKGNRSNKSRKEQNDSELRVNSKKQYKTDNDDSNLTIGKGDTGVSDDDTIKISKHAVKKKNERLSKFFGDDNDTCLSGNINEKSYDKLEQHEQNSKKDENNTITHDDEIKSSRHTILKRKERLSKLFGDDDVTSVSDKMYDKDVDKHVQSENDTRSNIHEDVATASDDEAIKSSKHAVKKRKERLSKLFGDDNDAVMSDEMYEENGDKQVQSQQMVTYTMHNSSNIHEDAAHSDDEIIKSTNRAVMKRNERLSKLFGDDNEASEKDSADQGQSEHKEKENGYKNNEVKNIEGNDVSNNCRTEVPYVDKENNLNTSHHAETFDDRLEIDMIDCLLNEFNMPFDEQRNGVHNETTNYKEPSAISGNLNQIDIQASGDKQNDSSTDKSGDINDKKSFHVREDISMEVNKDSQDTDEPDKVNSCLENIQITNITSITNKIHIFVCQDCNYGTDAYDEVIRHCQNHYNQIEDQVTYCNTCQIHYDISTFERHQAFHDSYLTNAKIKFSYRWLFTNWQAVFENSNITLSEAEDMQVKSIYKTFCIRMTVKKDGLWQSALYLCAKCSTCVPPLEIEKHVQQKCTLIKCRSFACGRNFLTNEMRTHHEIYHKNEDCNLFKTIVFNDTNDECFNTTLMLAKANNKQKQGTADIFKCLCGLCFNTLKTLKLHFVDCDSEVNDGTQCPRCSNERRFSATELEGHLSLHSSLSKFRVKQIAFRQESNVDISVQETPMESLYTRVNSTQMSDDEDIDVKKDMSRDELSSQGQNMNYAEEDIEGDIKDEPASQTSNDATDNTRQIMSIAENFNIKRDMLKEESLSQVSSEEHNRNLNNSEGEVVGDINEETILQTLNGATENATKIMCMEEDLNIKRDMLKVKSLSQVTNEAISQRLNSIDEEIDNNIKEKTISQSLNGSIENSTQIMSIEEDLNIKRDMLKEESLSQVTTAGENSQEFQNTGENDEVRGDALHDVNEESEHPINPKASQKMEAAGSYNSIDIDVSKEITGSTEPDSNKVTGEPEHPITKQALHENKKFKESAKPTATETSKETKNVVESKYTIVGGQQEIAKKPSQTIDLELPESLITTASRESKEVKESEQTTAIIPSKEVAETENPTIIESSQETSEEASQEMEVDEREDLVILGETRAMAKESRQETATKSSKGTKRVANTEYSTIIDLEENEASSENINELEAPITIEESDDDDVEFVCEGKLSTLTIRTEYKR